MSTNTGFIDLMGFARGQELGNQMNWRDVINDINTRQSEQNLQMQQDDWALKLPKLQADAQDYMDTRQARREGGEAIAGIYQQAAALDPAERSKFLSEQINSRIRSLDTNTAAGAAQVRGLTSFSIQQANEALKLGDREGAANILRAANPGFVDPMSGEAQLRDRQGEYFKVLNERFPGMFVQNPITGAPVNISEWAIVEKQMRDRGILPPVVGAGYGGASTGTPYGYGAGNSYTDMNDWKVPGTEVIPGYATGGYGGAPASALPTAPAAPPVSIDKANSLEQARAVWDRSEQMLGMWRNALNSLGQRQQAFAPQAMDIYQREFAKAKAERDAAFRQHADWYSKLGAAGDPRIPANAFRQSTPVWGVAQ